MSVGGVGVGVELEGEEGPFTWTDIIDLGDL